MITRSKMRRQLYRGGGIAGLYPRQKYGVGDFVRKLIPNEIADVAVKAAPFVAPFNPAVAGLMRGIGRYDQRGNLSDAFKQGILTYGGGQLARGIGGAPLQGNPFIKDGAFRGGLEGFKSGFSSPLSPERTQSFKNLFKGKDASNTKNLDEFRYNESVEDAKGFIDSAATTGTEGVVAYEPSSLKNIWNTWQNMDPGMKTAIVGVGSGSLAGLAQWFENQIPQEPGESMDEYLARRKVAVGKLMRQYMENTRAYDSAWTSMTDQQKDETVAKANMNQGGRVGYQAGGISMGNTLAQNIAANKAQAMRNQGVLQKARNTQQATGILDAAMRSADPNDPGGSLTNIYNKYFYGKNTGVPAGTFNMGNRKMSYTSSERDNIIRGIASQLGNQTTYRATPPTDPLTGMLQSQMLPNNSDGSMKSLAEQNAIRDKVLAAQAAQDKYFVRGTGIPRGPNGGYIIDGKEYFSEQEAIDAMGIERYSQVMSKGGRVGLYAGGEPEAGIKSLDAGAPNITYEGNEGPQAPIKMAGPNRYFKILEFKINELEGELGRDLTDEEYKAISEEAYEEFNNQAGGQPLPQDPTKPINPFQPKPKGIQMAAKGGRIGYRMGMGPAGLPGIPRQAPDGMEFDMRQNGGFQGLGAKEGKDDVPAMLAKNEFVFTADAVKGAGGGDVELGAQRMYDTMRNLEKRMA